MRELIGELRLDPERIAAVASAREALGMAYFSGARESETPQPTDMLIAQTHWRWAAGLRLLLDDVTTAQRLFRRAADVLSESRQPFGALLRSLSEPDRELNWRDEPWRYTIDDMELSGAHVFLLMHPLSLQEGLNLKVAGFVRERIEPLAAWQVGRLGLTVRVYLDLFDAVAGREEVRVSKLAGSLSPILTAYDRALMEAMQDSFHWTRLMSSLHPVEAEMAAVVSAVARTVAPNGHDMVADAIAEIPTSPLTRSIVRGLLEHR